MLFLCNVVLGTPGGPLFLFPAIIVYISYLQRRIVLTCCGDINILSMRQKDNMEGV
jgi:hypothetical protein